MVSAVVRSLETWVSASRFNTSFAALCAKGATSATGAAALSLCCLVSAALPGHAQSQSAAPDTMAAPAPLLGFVSPDEIIKIVRAAGFTPLAPARRQGTTYELRATDYRDVLMRVVVDGRSGAVRAVNRIVPARPEGVVGLTPPPDTGPTLYKPPAFEPLPSPPPAGPSPMIQPPPPAASPASRRRRHRHPRWRRFAVRMRLPRMHSRCLGRAPQILRRKKQGHPGKVPSAAPAAPYGQQIAPRPAPVTSKRQPQIATPD
jgi:hypothetical protein